MRLRDNLPCMENNEFGLALWCKDFPKVMLDDVTESYSKPVADLGT